MNGAILTMLAIGGLVGGTIVASIWRILREEMASSEIPSQTQTVPER